MDGCVCVRKKSLTECKEVTWKGHVQCDSSSVTCWKDETGDREAIGGGGREARVSG